ncbi:MAG: endo alpha-1,4 polygalactosaminidase [Anaerolineales bacterium]|nr:endo alpha-1,4 polygalactosaminidase [Anaerolineales bacterium]
MHIQYSGEIDLDQPVDVYNLDLFDTDAAVIHQLQENGIFVMCYFSAGSYEDWRADAASFPQEILGNDMEGWPGEIWLDIRQIVLLEPIIQSRLDMAVIKGCDGVDPDNVNGFENDTGFPLNYEDQLTFNIFLSNAAHERGLAIGLKNDLSQIPDLITYFDWALNEQCFFYKECDALSLFIRAGKPVFVIEYELPPQEFCPLANELNFNAMQKKRELDAFYFPCN